MENERIVFVIYAPLRSLTHRRINTSIYAAVFYLRIYAIVVINISYAHPGM